MKYWEMIYEAYREMVMAAQLAQQECLALLEEWRFDDAEKVGQSRTGYYECAIAALKLL